MKILLTKLLMLNELKTYIFSWYVYSVAFVLAVCICYLVTSCITGIANPSGHGNDLIRNKSKKNSKTNKISKEVCLNRMQEKLDKNTPSKEVTLKKRGKMVIVLISGSSPRRKRQYIRFQLDSLFLQLKKYAASCACSLLAVRSILSPVALGSEKWRW